MSYVYNIIHHFIPHMIARNAVYPPQFPIVQPIVRFSAHCQHTRRTMDDTPVLGTASRGARGAKFYPEIEVCQA